MSTIKFLALYFWTKYREQKDACMKCVLYIAFIFYMQVSWVHVSFDPG